LSFLSAGASPLTPKLAKDQLRKRGTWVRIVRASRDPVQRRTRPSIRILSGVEACSLTECSVPTPLTFAVLRSSLLFPPGAASPGWVARPPVSRHGSADARGVSEPPGSLARWIPPIAHHPPRSGGTRRGLRTRVPRETSMATRREEAVVQTGTKPKPSIGARSPPLGLCRCRGYEVIRRQTGTRNGGEAGSGTGRGEGLGSRAHTRGPRAVRSSWFRVGPSNPRYGDARSLDPQETPRTWNTWPHPCSSR